MLSQEFMRNALLAGTFIALACGVSGWFVVLRGQVFAGDALSHFSLRVRGSPQTTQIAFDISGEHGHTRITERLCQALQSDGLAGARGASNQPVTVGQAHGLGDRLAVRTGANKELRGVRHFVTFG